MAFGGYTKWYEFYSVLPVEPGASNNSIFVGSPGSPFGIDLSPFRAQGNGNGIRFRYDPDTDTVEVSLSLILSTLNSGVWAGNPTYWDRYGHTVPAGSGNAVVNSFGYHIVCNGSLLNTAYGPHANTLGPESNGLQSNGDAYIAGAPNFGGVFRMEHTFTFSSGIGSQGTATFTFSMNVHNSLVGQTAIATNQATFTVAEILGTYVPMSIRNSGSWRSLNKIPKGFIRRRVSGSWANYSEETLDTPMVANTGHNRIRNGGSFKQLPPM